MIKSDCLGNDSVQFGCDNTLPQVVISRGNPCSRLMLIGEAPGAMEDTLGKPFVGRSGKLLDQLLEKVGIDYENDIYISNLVKCRPPKNRRPTKSEITSHLPWLLLQIKLIQPYVLVFAGSTVLQTFLGMRTKITQLRGSWQNWNGIAAMPIYHPSYLLRNPSRAEGAPFDLTRLDLAEVKKKWMLLSHF